MQVVTLRLKAGCCFCVSMGTCPHDGEKYMSYGLLCGRFCIFGVGLCKYC